MNDINEWMQKIARKAGTLLWSGLQKLTTGAGIVIAALIKGIFDLLRDYFRHKREFYHFLEEKENAKDKMVVVACRHAIEKNRERICLACFLTPIGLIILFYFEILEYNSLDLWEKNFIVYLSTFLLLFIFPFAFFHYQTEKLERIYKNLSAFLRKEEREE